MEEQKVEIIKSKEAFYATGVSLTVNETEFVINFEQKIPGVEPSSRTIVLPSNVLPVLNQGVNNSTHEYYNLINKERQ